MPPATADGSTSTTERPPRRTAIAAVIPAGVAPYTSTSTSLGIWGTGAATQTFAHTMPANRQHTDKRRQCRSEKYLPSALMSTQPPYHLSCLGAQIAYGLARTPPFVI